MENNEKRETLADNFPSNSKTKRLAPSAAEKPIEGKKTEKVVTGKVIRQKKGLGKKIAETFLEDDTRTVGSYIFHDVLIPAAKSMICDMVGWGGIAEMMLFGTTKGSRTVRQGGKSFTSYGSCSTASYRGVANDSKGRELSRINRARHNFDEIVLETRGDAEEVLSLLVDYTIDYQQATVADLYDLVGVEGNFTDEKYGWTDLRSASVTRGRKGGYILNLPRPQPLD